MDHSVEATREMLMEKKRALDSRLAALEQEDCEKIIMPECAPQPQEANIISSLYSKAVLKKWGELTSKGIIKRPIDLIIQSREEYELICEYRHAKDIERYRERSQRIAQTKKRFGTLDRKK
jgi:hypothetical protein